MIGDFKKRMRDKLFDIASDFWEEERNEEALAVFYASALLGEASSQLNLGYFYEQGIIVEKNPITAIYWYKRSFINGESSAICNLAILYEDIDKLRLSRYWFNKASKGEDGDAFFQIGLRYYSGKGAYKKNHVKALHFFQKSINSVNITRDSYEKSTLLIKKILACQSSEG